MYVMATVGIAGPGGLLDRTADAELDTMIDHVEAVNSAAGPGEVGASVQVTMTIAAESVLQAIGIGVAHVERYGEPLYVAAEPERRRDLREGFWVAPAWLGVNDVAASAGPVAAARAAAHHLG